jgi:hypothetical protein
MPRVRQVFVLAVVCGVAACAAVGMNSVKKVNQLSPGMDREPVVQILGEPKSSEVKDNQTILKYTLHENWKGFVPYYFVFDNDTGRLVNWYEDEAEYQRMQQQMAQALEPVLEKQQQGAAATPAGPNDPDLQRWITGRYYYFSSSAVVSASSERTFVLCVDGQFRITGEFSASESGAWGAASRSGNAGRWTISGNRQSGTITLAFAGGATRNVAYRIASQQEQTMDFDGVRFVYAGVAECR